MMAIDLKLPQGQVVGVFGPVSSGKTYLMRHLTENDNRKVTFDYTGEAAEEPGAEVIHASPKALNARIKENPYYFRIAYVPGRDVEHDFSQVLNVLWFKQIHKLFILDEIHTICPVNAVDEDMETLLRFARHDKMSVVGASQRIADVHKLFTSCCRMTILFHTQEARDLDAIEDRWSCAEMVENLRPLIRDDISGKVSQQPECIVCVRGAKPRIVDLSGI